MNQTSQGMQNLKATQIRLSLDICCPIDCGCSLAGLGLSLSVWYLALSDVGQSPLPLFYFWVVYAGPVISGCCHVNGDGFWN